MFLINLRSTGLNNINCFCTVGLLGALNMLVHAEYLYWRKRHITLPKPVWKPLLTRPPDIPAAPC